MRKAMFSGLLVLLVSANCIAQTEDDYTLTVEEHAVDGVLGTTTYRIYVDMFNPDDFLSSVYGNDEDPFELTTSGGFYNDAAATGGSAGGINPAFLLPPFDALFPGLAYDSWFTIGIANAPAGEETAISAVESAVQPWIGCFDATSPLSGQDVVMNDITGGAWYVLNGTPNGLPDAENQRVLCAQITTSGNLSGIFNVQLFVNGDGDNDVRPRFVFDGPGVYSNDPLPEAVPGCMDADACNYNMDATEDDGSCLVPDAMLCESCDAEGGIVTLDADGDGVCDGDEVAGCQDDMACNFNVEATDDDGSCLLADDPCEVCDGMGGVLTNDQDGDGICDEDETAGCTDMMACNYNENVTDDDGSCEFADDPCEVCDQGSVALLDADGDGVCDSDEIVGCQDEAACNYDEWATDAGDCEYAEAEYDCNGFCLNDLDNDGVCDAFEIEGCQDEAACNYDGTATDAGDCEYAEAGYDCLGACLMDMDGDGVCDEFEVVGCQDEMACNYDASATDEGDCQYPDAGYDCDGNCLMDMDGDGVCDEFEVAGCDDDMACNYNEMATDNDGSCIYPETGYDCDGNCLNDADEDGICDEFEVGGCTDEEACNYNELATDDDGSCVYAEPFYDCDGNCLNDADGDGVCDELEVLGCTDSEAYNYNEDATEDDGSCAYCDLAIVVDEVSPISEENQGSISVTVTGTVGGELTYSWTGPDGYVNDSEDIDDASVAGTYLLTVVDENGCEAQVEVEVEFVDSVAELNGLVLQVYPNPVSDVLTFASPAIEGGVWVRLVDNMGRVCLELETQVSGGTVLLPIGHLANGCYHYLLASQGASAQGQVVIAH